MPAERRVLAVRYGRLDTTRSHAYLNYGDYGEPDAPQRMAYYLWVVMTPSSVLVVDTGFSRAGGDRRARTMLVDPRDALARLGVDRDFGGDIILTHSHYDHVGNIGWYRRARLIMSRAEYGFATGPAGEHTLFSVVTEPDELAELQRAREEGRLAFVDEIDPLSGIELVDAPGHTPGQLMVRVDGDPPILLTSDVVHFEEELDRDMPFRNMTDLPAAYASFGLVRDARAAGDRIVVGHDDAIAHRYPAEPGDLGFAFRVS